MNESLKATTLVLGCPSTGALVGSSLVSLPASRHPSRASLSSGGSRGKSPLRATLWRHTQAVIILQTMAGVWCRYPPELTIHLQ